MPTIAIVGAGSGLGLALARTFGSRGFTVALIARNREKLDALVEQLASEGITAAAFTADVHDRPRLTQALTDAALHFGGIDVLEYSPGGTAATTKLVMPSQSSPDDVQSQIEFQLYGAITATAAVLPALRDAGTGTLLFTTGAGSVDPVPMVGNVNAAAAALRNWAINLHKELAGTGVYAAHVGIDVVIGGSENNESVIPGFPVAPAQDIAAAYWDLHVKRQEAEFIFTAP
ncbi:SDR family NAD(P)-dependent oxidoreductase [Mycolicibacterium fluoranthenivorans]|jgi:NADP-dependent 3-hydroxy acid dehydrogenase YdfG|uniref:SDR family NAD(P)-dependent oxidoreductase n=1 Tax=Mycolicibacterium fluoranthenivorans TaxID=258505 RepID=A0A1G4V776_9MYCO|nr:MULTISPECIES: SDR family NAD(P)-dependent oxidoreductase [Mycobacteriaceae]MCV7254856.1 SDR family NAD(P)-dependent oxidoreductase [Mycobacterium hackensackense]QNJ91556.1 SDR family NAD(P)-dependent oxidoreductase [Mycolicibacterium fluoranthenivorans]SCX02343.1 short chain dehydrogenase [Mycolicibacterium fluoranthenivorans]